ncbi:aspartate carbamoyltransferase catalytic subunit [Paenibacillus provencensis]|uniref:Aspartate carbamoyltransferase n=1 Tax=Paenibacillus provencensis TaxID=441151 RepID=A0ABW3PQX1_9BACL|nr:aspartate carbamoyltransferase catalytic subunit [Paenibacillus sp. MER 78]MCM3126284.1 aspartate carbamoyltransferase catalytic subunit [Paenibacillus sp. MER 78]
MILTAKSIKERSLLGLKELAASEIESILDRASHWDKQEEKLVPVLASKFVANMFFENSTRTRFSFEMAEKRLGAEVLNFAAAASSVAKGESIYDTVRTLESMGIDAGVIRLKPEGVLAQLAEKVKVPLVNAGDGNNEHPTQALLDLYTMRQSFGSLKGLNVSIIGDIKHSRVARSNLWALQKLGANVTFCAPDMMKAPELEIHAPYISIDEALKADVVMMLRVQLERHDKGIDMKADEYRKRFGLTVERAAKLNPSTIIMHPAPVNRNVEIDDAVVESPASRIFPQMSNGVPIRMAVMERALLL